MVEEEENNFIFRQALNQNMMHITGNPLRDAKTERNLAIFI